MNKRTSGRANNVMTQPDNAVTGIKKQRRKQTNKQQDFRNRQAE